MSGGGLGIGHKYWGGGRQAAASAVVEQSVVARKSV